MLCEVSFCNLKNFQKHIDAVFLRADIQALFTSSQNTKGFSMEKNNKYVPSERTFQNSGISFLLQL